MSPRKRAPYRPDEKHIYISRPEARKLIRVDLARTFDDLNGFWLIPEGQPRKVAHKVYRLADILALRRNGARPAATSRQAQA